MVHYVHQKKRKRLRKTRLAKEKNQREELPALFLQNICQNTEREDSMKEKKTWKKRVLSIVLAFAMVLTQFGVWNAGKESVQAAENDSFTLYYYNESEEPLYV